MNKRNVKTALVFSLLVFLILMVTLFSTAFISMLLYRIGAFSERDPKFPLYVFVIISLVLGTVFSKIVGRRPIGVIKEISNATKEIAKGNFDIRLKEGSSVEEFSTMAENFNIMAKELANTEMLRNDFIENVSHEFKTPLSAIEGYVTLLQRKNLPEETRLEYTQKILSNTKRLSSLTGNILLLSRLENQETEIKKESYSLDEQLRETILLFESEWTSKKLDLDIDLDTVDYYGNKELLMQVWQNIIGNAIKFVENSGKISVTLTAKEKEALVCITDNGPGMSEEVVKRVYEKFYQGDSSRASSGNGLGLSLAKRIVDLHGGNIAVSSEPGTGSTFTVSLPVFRNS